MRLRLAGPLFGLAALLVLIMVAPAPSTAWAQGGGGIVVARLANSISAQSLDGREPSLADQGYFQVTVPPGHDPQEYADRLEATGLVESTQVDARVYAAETPNDPLYPGAFAGSQEGYMASIGAPEAWDLATGNPEVIVAVLDSGADLSHPDLSGQLWVNEAEIPDNGVDDDHNGCVDDVNGCRFIKADGTTQAVCGYANNATATGAVADDNGSAFTNNHSHGTMVTGITGATGNNSRGIAGVAWNVRLMIVKVLDCGGPSGGRPGGNMSDVALGIDYARRMGARIINLSLASRPGDNSADLAVLRTAIEQARNEGVIIVAAAGNTGSQSNPTPGYPAAYTQYENVIGVGASDWQAGNVWAPFSSYGQGVDFAAPGTSITSTVRTDLGLPSGYGTVSVGTSFSTPLVTGAFAVLAARNPRLPFQTYIDALAQTAAEPPPSPNGGNWAGFGIIDIGKAVERIPMLITGSALHDWLDIPAGARMEARISGRVCGSTTSQSIALLSRFELTVAADAAETGCGAPGREVEIYIDGQPAVPKIPWGGPNQTLALTGRDVSTVSPPPGPIVVQPLSQGWNNIAHFEANGPLPNAFDYLPGGWTAAYTWDPLGLSATGQKGTYRRVIHHGPEVLNTWPVVTQYEAYWVDSPTATNAATVNPDPPPGLHANFEAGWNNFVYTGTSKSIPDALANIDGKYTTVLQYDNESGEWRIYIPGRHRSLNGIGGLLTMQVYWIYMAEPGAIVMN